MAFFVCWAPFHGQRLMILYIPASKWTVNVDGIHKTIYYVSGVCYFISCTINPILYSIMSLKFRQAFKQTVLKPNCCNQKIHSSPKRNYCSYRFSHKNGYSETSFTSVDAVSPRVHKEHNSDHSSGAGVRNFGNVMEECGSGCDGGCVHVTTNATRHVEGKAPTNSQPAECEDAC